MTGEGYAPNPRQLDAAKACLEDEARVVVLDGAIRSGKTQAAARILLDWAAEQPATYLVGRATYRSLRDSTMKAMLYGDGALPPLIPPQLVEQYRASDEIVRLRNGAEIMFRSLEESDISKILNLSLAGVLVDQIEELDAGDAGERVFDTLLGRLSDPRGPRKLLAVANPAGLTSWQYRRLIDERTRDRAVRRVRFTLRDNASNLPADYVAAMEATQETRPHWYRSFILGEWGAFEGQAYPEFEERLHVVAPFEVPAWWERFESMDHGAANPTAWHAWAADDDGNVVVFGEHYEAGELVSHHAQRVLALRKKWHPVGDQIVCWADPSIGAKHGLETDWGEPASIKTEYAEHGIVLAGANNDRAAGYARLRELLHVEAHRIAPPWSQVPASVGGAPRLYVFATCTHLVEQLRSAPIAVDGVNAGECVDPKWESARGHSHASARYGAMSRPDPSVEPDVLDPLAPVPPEAEVRAEATRRMVAAQAEEDEEVDQYDYV